MLLRLFFVVLALLLGVLALGAFASLNPASPTWMRTLSAAEGVLLGSPTLKSLHLMAQPAFVRGAALAVLAAACVFLAAWPSRPAAPTVPRQ